ncbi:sensor histidine kinase [Capillimicrobium parvum]|uniref:histidine kinase n=1 Tax=Capillimicrobium parvum TaxID=2884022 RepID=A0A9E7C0M8_9ACTN|nr:HAMP domain-containing sensor histidine kinase [Capillimicrobium parvum]UGS35697.1 Adaptive-response sensory-kinase SasA [Capillimicrobium parvum]
MSWAMALVALSGLGLAWFKHRRRMELVTRALHELRSPLCAARLAVHAAGRERGWPAVARIDDELGRAALALDDLDAARRGRSVSPHLQEVDTGELLGQVGVTWAPLAWPVGRRVRVEPPVAAPVVHADPVRLAQALGNLVGNALEHGTGDVVLSVSVAGSWARLSVADGGSGLPAPLGTLRRRARGGRGSRGRGLAIADEIARRHGGRLESSPADAAGCRMTLDLPLPVGEVEDQGASLSLHLDGIELDRSASRRWSARPAPVDSEGLRWGGTVQPLRRRR